MGKLIGVRPIKNDSGEQVELHVFDNGTYRYEPGYTNADGSGPSSFYKIDDGEVFFRHEENEAWHSTNNLSSTEFVNIIKDIVNEHIVEQILLK